MKYARTLMILFLAAALIGGIVINANEVMAKVGDNVQAVCSVCHTMHHSQDGTDPDVGFDAGTQSTGPNPALLYGATGKTEDNRACVACHTDSTGGVSNGYDQTTGAPLVNLGESILLAGGTYSATTATAAKRHDVEGFLSADTTLTIPPGGSADDIEANVQVSCAGKSGCHGDRSINDNVESIHGAHHTDDSVTLDGSTVGLSFRFLSTNTNGVGGTVNYVGVRGKEHTWWESGKKDSLSLITTDNAYDHNVYQANHINLVCASCHGQYHTQEIGYQGESEPWIRHPTDISLTTAAAEVCAEYLEYPGEGTGNNLYSNQAPVGYTQTQITDGSTDSWEGQVLCISCHRAHGSEWDDILRWNYDTMKASTGTGSVETGCNRCHTTK